MLRAADLTYTHPGADAPAVRGVSLRVPAGRTLAVMGPNGAGKTTLLKLLAGLREPDAGSVDVADGADGDRAVVGFAPEDPETVLFAETVEREVAFFPRNRGLDVEERTRSAMRATGVTHLRDRSPASLSAGERRRVAIAAVLAGDPAALVLDEPTNGLHAAGQRAVGELLADLDRSVVVSTHAADFAYAHADAVLVLDRGAVARVGDPAAVLADEDLLESAGIRPPGNVAWARRQSIDRVPDTVGEAVALLERGG